MKRWDIINSYIHKNGYKTYLEIGLQSGICRDHIQLPLQAKTTVDPDTRANNPTHLMTSDEFFEQNDKTFDIIFIDGLHHAEQVLKDIMNSLEVLNEGGMIFCHDMLPTEEIYAKVPRESDIWNGDCYKAWFKLLGTISDLEMFIVERDHGVGVIKRGKQERIPELNIPMENMTWDFYMEHKRKNTMNKIDGAQFKQHNPAFFNDPKLFHKQSLR
jgi:hypothetical protein